MVALYGLLSTLKVRTSRHSGLDPESHQTFREVVSFRVDEGILNRVQDDKTAVIPDPDPESPQRSRRDPSSLYVRGILNQVQDDGGATTGDGYRSCVFHHGFVGFGGIRPCAKHTNTLHYSLFTIHYSLDNFPGKLS